MPAGLDEDDRGVRFEARVEVVVVPIPEPVAVGFAFGLCTALYRIVDDDKLAAETCDARTDADRLHSAAKRRFPLRYRVYCP